MFFEINDFFSISAKIQDGGRKIGKVQIFRGARIVALIKLLGVRNLPEITLLQFLRYFPFPPQFKMAAKIRKSQHFRGPSGVVLTTLGVQHLLKISLSFRFLKSMVFSICAKIQDGV